MAGVDFSYPGSLSLLIGSYEHENDPWSVERLTFWYWMLLRSLNNTSGSFSRQVVLY